MEIWKRGQHAFRSLPRRFISAIRTPSAERTAADGRQSSTPLMPRRRNGISVDSYSELRSQILQSPLPTTVLQRAPSKEFMLIGIGLPIVASSYYILTVINESSVLIVFNKDNELYRIDLSETLVFIHDLCWSSKLNVFLMAGYSLHTFNPHSKTLSTIERVQLARGEWIMSITSDSTSMFLLLASSSKPRIERRSLLPSFALDTQWPQEHYLLKRKDFTAQCVRINEWNVLAMTIKQRNGEWRVDLFNSLDLQRTHRGCSLGASVPGMRNCLLMSYERSWLIINNCSIPEEVILLDENGRIKSKTTVDKPRGFINLCTLDNEYIAMRVQNSLRLYKIQ